MSDIKIQPSATGSGTVTITAPTTNTARVITLPDSTATVATTTDVAARLSSIVDGGNATAITIDSSEKVGIGVTALTRQLAIGTLGTKTDTATKYVMNIGQTTESSGHAGLGVYFAGHANAASRKWQFQPGEAGVANDGIIEMNPDGGYFRANRGVLFGTDTAAANILDDYEEGTFTPAASGGASSTSGSYTKIGRLVTCHGTLTFPSQTNSGHAQVEGLPFTTVNADGFSGFIRYTNYNPKQIMMHGNPNSTTFGLYEVDYGSSVTQVTWTEISGIRFDFTVVYFAA